MSKKLIVGNWKMNPQSSKDAEKLFKSISQESKKYADVSVAICAPAVFIPAISKVLQKKVAIGAQNVFYEMTGAYTGEVSAEMLKSFKTKFSLVGHSERRKMGETNEDCNKKIIALLKNGITPILCVGEKERTEDISYLVFVYNQLKESLLNIPKSKITDVVIAYEPVWAIGKNAPRAATPEECKEMVLYIRKVIADMTDPKTAHSMRVMYGASVSPADAPGLLSSGVDGLLVGRDSLDAKKFASIIRSASKK